MLKPWNVIFLLIHIIFFLISIFQVCWIFSLLVRSLPWVLCLLLLLPVSVPVVSRYSIRPVFREPPLVSRHSAASARVDRKLSCPSADRSRTVYVKCPEDRSSSHATNMTKYKLNNNVRSSSEVTLTSYMTGSSEGERREDGRCHTCPDTCLYLDTEKRYDKCGLEELKVDTLARGCLCERYNGGCKLCPGQRASLAPTLTVTDGGHGKSCLACDGDTCGPRNTCELPIYNISTYCLLPSSTNRGPQVFGHTYVIPWTLLPSQQKLTSERRQEKSMFVF